MKKTFYDEYEEVDYEIEIPDDLYKRAYEEHDYDALYEVGVILETETEAPLYLVADIMYEAYDDGKGSDDALYWLQDYRFSDGAADPYA